MDNETLATEMLRELKANNERAERDKERSEKREKRWFIAFIIALVLWFLTIGLFIAYLNQPVEETITYTQDADSDGNSSINQQIGD